MQPTTLQSQEYKIQKQNQHEKQHSSNHTIVTLIYKSRSLSRVLYFMSKHEGNVENTGGSERFLHFSSVLKSVSGVFYHSVIHGLGFSICFMIYMYTYRSNKLVRLLKIPVSRQVISLYLKYLCGKTCFTKRPVIFIKLLVR